MLDILQLVQLVFLLSGFVLGFLICVPIGINKQKFNSCILYAELTYDSSDKLLKFKELGQLSSCNYCIYVGVAGIVLALVLFIVGCVILYNSRDASTNEER